MIRSIVSRPGLFIQSCNKRFNAQLRVDVASPSFRLINAEEAEKVCKFGEQEMTRTFRHLYNEKDFAEYVAEAYTTEKYLNWIKSSECFVYGAYSKNVTGDEGELVAYVLAGSCRLPVPREVHDPLLLQDAGEIKRIYAHPSTFGTGVSATLLVKAMEWLRSGADQANRDIYLGVYSENDRALKFYSKYGFKRVAEYKFPIGNQSDREFILRNSVNRKVN